MNYSQTEVGWELRSFLEKLNGVYSGAVLISGGKGNPAYPVSYRNEPVKNWNPGARAGGVVWSKGDLEIFQFDHGPCITGTYRKYKNTHPDATSDCPNPGDVSPPFPSGLVEAFMIKMEISEGPAKDWAIAMLSNESPWKSGFGDQSSVERIEDAKGNVKGLIFWDLEVNPTVLGNLLRFLHRVKSAARTFWPKYLSLGLTEKEALIATACFPGGDATKNVAGYDYIMKPVVSLKNVRDGVCKDLSKGKTFRQGGDYNRSLNETIFQSGKDDLNVLKWMDSKHPTEKTFVPLFRQMLSEQGAGC